MNPSLEALSHHWAVAVFVAVILLVCVLMLAVSDVEALFLYAWAVSLRESGWIGFIEAATFIFILTAGLVYLWRIGALRWAPAPRRRPREH